MKNIVLLVSSFLVFLLSCSENTTGPSGEPGRIILHMTDAPADYEQVNIVVERVEVHKAEEGWFVVNDVTNTYDLLELRNGASVVIADTFLEPGHYTQMRLIIGEGSNIVVDGISYPLEIPSGMQTGVKLIHNFLIDPGVTYELMLDFEAENSIVVTGSGRYLLKPTIRIMPVVVAGTISGTILPVEAEAEVVIEKEGNRVQTHSAEDGFFKVFVEQNTDYKIHIKPSDPGFKEKVISDISVTAGQNTDIGVIVLSP
jgi:hypothetical protein